MQTHMGKPLALVDNRTGHLMLLVDGQTLNTSIDSGIRCTIRRRDGKAFLDLSTHPDETSIGPFSETEAEKLQNCHRLTVALFSDGLVTRAREVSLVSPSVGETLSA